MLLYTQSSVNKLLNSDRHVDHDRHLQSQPDQRALTAASAAAKNGLVKVQKLVGRLVIVWVKRVFMVWSCYLPAE